MSEELLLSVTPQETRVAIIINGVLREILIERQRARGLVGNIYRGRVARVLPGMQAAFVDIGLQRSAFLHAANAVPKIDDRVSRGVDGGAVPDIKLLVREGDTVVVQVLKDPLGSKGARVTTQLSIASRYLVLLPGSSRVGISQRITQPSERERLTQQVIELSTQLDVKAGFIVRTVADGASVESLKSDLLFLVRSWEVIRERLNSNDVGLLHEDLPLTLRTARDLVT
ncbi:MAG TPA: Rne/Rng family ribonuclease, partial [Gammaproteobacteria bacterium]|nr:Rne/Rng family ribonuclease [Gammaproteobacteria bacterium]